LAKQTLGKYEVLERLGRGGMAEVFRGYHATLDRYVAIKVLHPFLAEDDEFRARFEKEARHIAKLSHPHIVQVYDFDFSDDRDSYYMVMELIAGITLKDRLYDLASRHERLPVPEVLRIVREAATALAYAHKRSMIHRDVKPANLMLDEDDRVVLTDFGIAKMLDSKQLTVSGGMIGTPAYMSPEQGLGEPGDERSDLYSLGVIMYQLLVGDLPYDAETALGVILMHVNDPIPIVRSYNPDVPQSVQNVVHRAMEKDPLKRYQTADELIADLDQCAVELDGGEAAVISPSNAELSSKTGGADETSDDGAQASTTTEDRLRPQASPGGAQRRFPWSVVLTVLLLVVGLGGGGIMASNAGLLPGFVQDTPNAHSGCVGHVRDNDGHSR
jgi:serine/threonine protein kinase